jgi:hypothetical protein
MMFTHGFRKSGQLLSVIESGETHMQAIDRILKKELTNKHIPNVSLGKTSWNHSTVHTSEENSFWL